MSRLRGRDEKKNVPPKMQKFMSNLKSSSPFTAPFKIISKITNRMAKETKKKLKRICEVLCYIVIWKRCQEFKDDKREKKNSPIYRSNESKKRIQRMIRFEKHDSE